METEQYNNFLKLIKEDWSNFLYISEQTPELCMAAVQQNGIALEYVKEQTHEICMAAKKMLSRFNL